MKILFIGGTGVISSASSNLCIEMGHDLFLLNRNQSISRPHTNAKIITADIRDVNSVKEKVSKEKFDVVVDWIAYSEEHVQSDLELFGERIDQYIFVSSASAYHKPPLKLPITEDTPLHNPFWRYSQKKINCENFLMKCFTEKNFPVTIVRPSHTYDKTRFPLYGNYTAYHRMKQNKNIILHGDGNTIWTLTNAKDFAKGFIGLIGNSKTIGEAYHITSDETLTWNQIAETVAKAAGLELNITHMPAKFISKYDVEWGSNINGDKGYDTVFDNSKIKSMVPEFKATISYSEGVKKVIEWYSEKDNQVVNHEVDMMMDKMIEDYES